MSAIREGLGEPLVQLPPETVTEIRTFLDGQSRIKAAAWARHEEPGNDHLPPDHHILLAVDDEDWATADLRALEDAIPLPHIAMVGPTWRDFFPVAELPEVRTFATLLWEQTTPGGDPLDYRYTYEPFVPESASVERFRSLLEAEPAVRQVAAALEKLWNGDELVEERVQLSISAPPPANALDIVQGAARQTILVGRSSYALTIGAARDEAAVLYEAR